MSGIGFKLPSSIAVVGVPLQLFLLFCFLRAGKITAVTALPGLISIEQLHLKPTYRQQLCSKISMRSFLAFLRREKKKHFQQVQHGMPFIQGT